MKTFGEDVLHLCGEVNYVARMTQMTILPPTLSNPSREKFDKDDRPLPQTSEGG